MKKIKKTDSPKVHAKYSPSASYRWLACPGSIKLCLKVPERKESAAALEGTDCHTCLEVILKNGPGKQLSSEAFLREKYPVQMVLDAAVAARQIWELAPKGAELLSETRSELFHIDPEFHGTTDASILEHFGLLHVIDFKYGRMPVEADENTQMISYAIGIARKYDYNFGTVRCTIIQPRAKHGNGTVRSWDTTMEELRLWEDRLKAGVKATKKKGAPLKSGEHCFFCDAKAICPEYSVEATGSVRARFVTPKSPEERRKQLLLDFG